MRWTERQRAMLREMGIRVWAPGAPTARGRTPAERDARRASARRVRAARRAAPRRRRCARAPAAGLADGAADGRRRLHRLHVRRDAPTVFGVGHRAAPTGWSSARRRASRKTARASPSSARQDSCSTTCCARSALARARRRRRAAGLHRQPLKCRPPRNRNPSRTSCACEPFLRAADRAGAAAHASSRWAASPCRRCSAATSRSAACAAACTATHGVPVVVTYHPAYLLRNPADKARAWADLCLAVRGASAEDGCAAAAARAGRATQRLRLTGRFQPASVACRARATRQLAGRRVLARSSSRRRSWRRRRPSTGATSTQLLPTCTSAPISVRCLLAPS